MISFKVLIAAALLTAPLSASTVDKGELPRPGGCTCPTGTEQLLDAVDHVFIGDLLQVKGSGEDAGLAVIRVRENLKGDLTGVVEVRDALVTQCAWSVFEMASPGRFIVFANLDEGDLVTPAFCPQTQPLSGWRDLAPLRAYARAHRPATPARANTAFGPVRATPKTGS